MRIQIVHSFDCETPLLWEVLLDEPFNDRLYQGLDMKERTILERQEDDRVLRRRIRYVPRAEIPAVVKKFINGEVSYVEETTYHKGKDRMDVKILPGVAQDKFQMGGAMKLRSKGPGQCEREFDAEITVKVMFVGGTVEKYIGDQIRKSYDVAAEEIRKEVARRK